MWFGSMPTSIVRPIRKSVYDKKKKSISPIGYQTYIYVHRLLKFFLNKIFLRYT